MDPNNPAHVDLFNTYLEQRRVILNRLPNLEPQKYRKEMEAALQEERLQVLREYPGLADSQQEARLGDELLKALTMDLGNTVRTTESGHH